jgi:hypothetical protein
MMATILRLVIEGLYCHRFQIILALQMENIKDRAALLGYDVWIAPRSSLVLQVSASSGNKKCSLSC